jgi:hypothetical protein
MPSAAALFATVPTSNHLKFFGKGGTDIKKAVDFLDLKKDDVASATNAPLSSVRFDERTPAEVRERLVEIATICEMVADYFSGDVAKTALWFKVPNPLLGNLSPRDQIRLGRYRKVLKFVQSAREAAGPPTRT